MQPDELDLEAMAATLEESGRYRVLRQLKMRPVIEEPAGCELRTGLFVDVETTGLDPTKDEIIELAIVPFTYGLDGRIFHVREPYQRFQQPSSPIQPQITALTGITDDMVAGQEIDPSEVETIVNDAALIIAHNAAFDRRFAERLSAVFAVKPWACSMTQVDWGSEGYEGTKLAYLAMGAGFFYGRHRAENDCLAAIELLATPLPRTGVPAMRSLLERARRPSYRVWAVHAPFDLKNVLKARGYRWNGEEGQSPRAWYIDVDEPDLEQERMFLQNEIYQRDAEPLVRKITAYERFSERT